MLEEPASAASTVTRGTAVSVSVTATAVALENQGWQYPSPDSEEQSWFDYIWSGKFTYQQSPLDRDNAHLILAETVIYCKHQPRKSPIKAIRLKSAT